MPEALTYDSLVSDIQVYAERSDEPFVTQIPRFIMLAENRLASEIHGLGFLRSVTFTLSSGNSILAKPSRWRENRSMTITDSGDKIHVFPRGYEYCREYWPDASVTDRPEYYADYDYEHFVLVPTPDADYSGELRYYERPEPLSSTNQTNWLTQYAPQLLLYASLLEAQSFLKLPERIPEFQNLYERAAQMLKTEDQMRMTDASANRSKA